MSTIPHLNKSRTTAPRCCSPTQAAFWLGTLTEMALVYHDDDARRALPQAVDHYLSAVSETALDAEEWPR